MGAKLYNERKYLSGVYGCLEEYKFDLSKWVNMIVETFIAYLALLGNLPFGTIFALSLNKCCFSEQVKDFHVKSWVDGNVLYGGKAISCAETLTWKESNVTTCSCSVL